MASVSPSFPQAISVDRLAEFYQSELIEPAAGVIQGPYGETRYVYADWTASGRSLRCIENYIERRVLPHYANTHSQASYSGQQMSVYREEARATIKSACGGTDEDVCLFTGSGATGAIQKLIDILDIRLAPGAESKAARDRLPDSARPIVLIGPWEHHSNLLAWRETTARVIEIPACATTGKFAYDSLSTTLQAIGASSETSPLLLGSFSAASNVTGVTLDMQRVCRMMHQYGGLVAFDCAAWASHLKVDMNPIKNDPAAGPDAIFMSPHKLAGGPGCPGVLLANRRIIRNVVPGCVGGGVVEHVTRSDSIWISDIETREEAGTPDIIGSIRCGLVFALKSLPVKGKDTRIDRTQAHLQRAWSRWSALNNLVWLGAPPDVADRVPIVSFQVRGLDMGFVNNLLSDLFGVQARDGCFCAHTYLADLLHLSDAQVVAFRSLYLDRKIYRQGATRVSFPWFMSEEEVTYIIEAVAWISEWGWKFLPEYRVDHATGKWTHRTYTRQLDSLSTSSLFAINPQGRTELPVAIDRPTLDTTIQKLEQYITNSYSRVPLLDLLKDDIPIGRFDRFRSFATPLEGALVRAAVKSEVDDDPAARNLAETIAWQSHLALISARTLPEAELQRQQDEPVKPNFATKISIENVPRLLKGPTPKVRRVWGRFFKRSSLAVIQDPTAVGRAQ